MFDKLVESDTTGAEFKNRSLYFMVSSVVVSVLFLMAVVYSLYAAEVGLGKGNFEIAALLSPVEMTEPKPERPGQRSEPDRTQRAEVPIRTENVAGVEESRFVPDRPLPAPSEAFSRPAGRFIIDPNGRNSDGGDPGGFGRGTPHGTGSSTSMTDDAEVNDKTAEPPPAVKITPRPKPAVSEGVVNGKATYLPIPEYSAAAKSINASGTVNVQVTIDESGNVMSAKAVTGHPLLQQAAERAAKKAKFSTTYLSRVPVKVTGVIVYNFKRN